MAWKPGKDRKGNPFIEIPIADGEHVRVTRLPATWVGQPGIRIQQNSGGHVRQGPELPFGMVSDLIGAVVVLLSPTKTGHFSGSRKK